jgi:hypothetical protein
MMIMRKRSNRGDIGQEAYNFDHAGCKEMAVQPRWEVATIIVDPLHMLCREKLYLEVLFK